MTKSVLVSISAILPALPPDFSCSSALTSSTVEKKDFASVMFDGLHTDGGGDVAFPVPGPPIRTTFSAFPEFAAMQLPDRGFIDVADVVEPCKILVGRKRATFYGRRSTALPVLPFQP